MTNLTPPRTAWESQPADIAGITAQTSIGDDSDIRTIVARCVDEQSARVELDWCNSTIASVESADGYDGTNFYEQGCWGSRCIRARILARFPQLAS